MLVCTPHSRWLCLQPLAKSFTGINLSLCLFVFDEFLWLMFQGRKEWKNLGVSFFNELFPWFLRHFCVTRSPAGVTFRRKVSASSIYSKAAGKVLCAYVLLHFYRSTLFFNFSVFGFSGTFQVVLSVPYWFEFSRCCSFPSFYNCSDTCFCSHGDVFEEKEFEIAGSWRRGSPIQVWRYFSN